MGFSWFSLGTIGDDLLIFLLTGAAVWMVSNLVAARRVAEPPAPAASPGLTELEQIRRFEGGMLALRGERLDVETEMRWVMTALQAEAQAGFVRQDIAVTPKLAVWMDPRAFRKLLVEALGHAIHSAPAGRVLMTAAPHGGRVQIGISHDGESLRREAAELALRPATELTALHGGTIEVISRAGRGATTLIRLPEPASSNARPSDVQTAGQPQTAAVAKPVVVAGKLLHEGLLSS